jgi:branched-chain amino acid transport system permease protein
MPNAEPSSSIMNTHGQMNTHVNTHGQNLIDAVKKAAMAAGVAFALFLPLVGFRSDVSPINSNLIVEPRWGLLFSLTIAIFALRLLISLRDILRKGRKHAQALETHENRATPYLVPILLTLLAFTPLIPGISRYEIDLGTLILTYVLLGFGLNIVVGFAGLLNLGYAAFYAIGAYTYALLATSPLITGYFSAMFGPEFWPLWSFWICLPLSGLAAAFAGFLLGLPVLRLRGDYLAIVTLAFGEIIRIVLINWVNVTQGAAGVSGVPRPSFFGLPFNAESTGFAATFGIPYNPMHRMIFLFYIVLALLFLTYFTARKLRKLPLGRAWKALREDEIACKSLGINIVKTKLSALSIGAFFGGIAGAFFATRQGFVSPESFTFMESAVILAIVVLAGSSEIGIVLAAGLLIGGVEVLRNLTFLKNVFGPDFEPTHYRMLIFGLAMVIVMLWRPRGLLPDTEPTAVLKDGGKENKKSKKIRSMA